MIYLDANATMPMKPAVCAAMVEAMARHGNPSSVHRYGRIAHRYVDEARAAVAALVGVKPMQVIFTSGGTEANNMALASLENVYASTLEHDSVLSFVPPEHQLPATQDGIVDLVAAEELLKSAPKGSLVSVMRVNNETGVIQPIEQIASIAKKYGHWIHCDAIQAAGRLPLDFVALKVDAMSLSAHKIGGPQGVGALIVTDAFPFKAMFQGGGQERGRRPGTENVPGIIGFGVAAQLAVDDLRDMTRIAALRDILQSRMKLIAGDDIIVAGANVARVANTLSVAMPGMISETQVAAMDLGGVAVSAGSACSSGKVKMSHVWRAMGYDVNVAGCALRLSLGWHTQAEDIERCIETWEDIYFRMVSARGNKVSENQAA